jgi:hypothetical protein
VKDVETGQTSTVRFDAGGGWDTQKNNQSARPDRVVLELDKKFYQANDKVKVKITPPYTGNGFIMVENSNQQLWFQRVEVPAEGMVVEIPIAAEWKRHDIYISAIVFRAGDSKEKITPNRAIGLVHLPLDRQQRELKVSIDAPIKAIRPETTLTTTIKVANAKAGQKTHVTLAAVDVGVLNITEFETPNPFKWFFEPRRYGVDQRDIYGQIIELVDAGSTKPRFGGDADKHAGGARPDTEVKIVSLFSGMVDTDAKGMAKIDLKIPDFNGKLRLMAVAFNDEQYGSADAEVIVAAPIIAETSLPRFLAAGDSAVLTLDLRNQSGEAQTIALDVSASAPITLSEGIKTITLANKEKQVLQLPIKAGLAFGQSVIQLHLKNADNAREKIALKREWKLGVRPAYPASTFVQHKIAKQGETADLTIDLQSLIVNSASSELSISTQPPINLRHHLQYLLEYPYGCLEQTISSTYPWLAINQTNLQALGLDKTKIHDKPIDLANKARYIERGISIIAGMQRSNGGFGLWSPTDNEEFWLTAYAVDFLLDAKEQGANVPQEMLDKALTRLTEYLNQNNASYSSYSSFPSYFGGENNQQIVGYINASYQSYAAYVLSRVNRAPLGSLRALYDNHHKEAMSGLPLVHLGLALNNQGDKYRGGLAISESLQKQPRTDLIYLNDYGSEVRDLAQMTYLLNKHSSNINGSGVLVYRLADGLANRDYLSTQERNALFRAGLQLQGQTAQWQGDLLAGKAAIKLAQSSRFTTSFNGVEIPSSLKFSSSTAAPLYLEYTVQGYPNKVPAMQMGIIQLERVYYNLQGQVVTLDKVKSGDSVLVDLSAYSTKPFKDAILVDLIPAGFELENQDLKNTIKIDTFKIGGAQTIEEIQNESYIKSHVEYLDDRFVSATSLIENQWHHEFYLLRAVSKGVFTNPPPYAEDMYRPYIRSIGREFGNVEVF